MQKLSDLLRGHYVELRTGVNDFANAIVNTVASGAVLGVLSSDRMGDLGCGGVH